MNDDWLLLVALLGITVAIAGTILGAGWLYLWLDDRRFARSMVQGFDHAIAKLGMDTDDE